MIHHGDCLAVMPSMDACSVDAIVCDPPYGLSFMGKGWDHGVPGVPFWIEALRVAKPGAHLLAFGGTRTFHRLTVAIEDAGWEIRDAVMWVYGSGFPKSLDVSKAIDKAAGAKREVVGTYASPEGTSGTKGHTDFGTKRPGEGLSTITAPATDEARAWEGWGTALKPAWEPIIVARKPLDGTVAANVLVHGTGALNIDASRVGTTVETWPKSRARPSDGVNCYTRKLQGDSVSVTTQTGPTPPGRWPANVIHDGSPEVLELFPRAKGGVYPAQRGQPVATGFGADSPPTAGGGRSMGDDGSAARFFYCAKANKKDRGEGNTHPTVKPHDLMRYLVRLVTPPGGLVLDPFMGSGSTGKAALAEGFRFVGIELDEAYCEIAARRLNDGKRIA